MPNNHSVVTTIAVVLGIQCSLLTSKGTKHLHSGTKHTHVVRTHTCRPNTHKIEKKSIKRKNTCIQK